MELFVKTFFTTISISLIVVLGVILRRKEIVNHKAKESLLKLLINVFLPCLIFDKVGLGQISTNLSSVLTPFLWGFLTISLGVLFVFALARFSSRFFGLQTFAQQRSFSLAVGMQNYGFLALPLAITLFPDQGVEGMMLIHNVGVEFAIWTVGILVLSGSKEHLMWRKLFNPPSIAIILSLIYKQLSLDYYISESLLISVKLLGAMAIPVGLLSVGFTIAENWWGHRFFSPSSIRQSLSSIGLRLLLLPTLIFLCLIWLEPSDILKKVMVIELAMPASLSPIYLSDYYKADSSTAFQVALTTTILGILTIGFWLVFGVQYFKLF